MNFYEIILSKASVYFPKSSWAWDVYSKTPRMNFKCKELLIKASDVDEFFVYEFRISQDGYAHNEECRKTVLSWFEKEKEGSEYTILYNDANRITIAEFKFTKITATKIIYTNGQEENLLPTTQKIYVIHDITFF